MEESKCSGKKRLCMIGWLVLAVVACFLLVLSLFVFGERYSTDYEVAEDAFSYQLETRWSDGFSVSWGMPFDLSVKHPDLENKDVVWKIVAHDGEFYLDEKSVQDRVAEGQTWVDVAYLGDAFSVKNDTLIQWTNLYIFDLETDSGAVYEGASTYIDAVMYADGQVVGFVIVEIAGLPNELEGFEEDEIAYFMPSVVASEFYPMVNGEFQNVTEEYVSWRMTLAKWFRN